MNRILFFAALALSLNVGAAAAQAYKCVENGKTTISTEPCPVGATTRAEIAVEPLPDANAARADEERLQRYVDNLARERAARDAAHIAEQKMKAEQAVLEARAQRDKAEAEVLRADADRRTALYDGRRIVLPYGFYGNRKYGSSIRGYGVRRNNSPPNLSVRIQSNVGNASVKSVNKGSAGRDNPPRP
ncbi:MAG: DUF4124 domain-containing protein [Zoogloeaceae bacterium]|jgi:hypothetical protein|nr:DUF4124 domain-containing protein [Zoogloeaceae bacterium]